MKSIALSVAVLALVAVAASAWAVSSPAPATAAATHPATATSTAATAPATGPSASASRPAEPDVDAVGPLIPLLAIGVILLPIILTLWIVRGRTTPEGFTLRNTPGRPNRLTIPHLLIPFLALRVPSLIAEVYCRTFYNAAPSTAVMTLVQLVDQLCLIAASLFVAAYGFSFGISNGLGLKLRHWLADLIRGVLLVLAVLPVVLGLQRLMMFLIPLHAMQNVMLDRLAQLPHVYAIPIWISAVVLAPLSEELFFRGIVQSTLRNHLRSPWAAIIIASLIFGAVHMPSWQDVVPLVVLGIALGYTYERTGRLIAPMIAHACFNGISLWAFMVAHHLW